MALEQRDLQILLYPFKRDEHEFIEGWVYLTEDAITRRIERVDRDWSFIIRETIAYGDSVVVHATLNINGVERSGVGGSSIQREAKEYQDKKFVGWKALSAYAVAENGVNAYKGAATDALKRCARLFGIGRYLLDAPKVEDKNNTTRFDKWLAERITAAKAEFEQSDDQSVPEIKLAEKPAQSLTSVSQLEQPSPQDLGELDWTAREGEDGVSVLVTDAVEVRMARTGKPFLTFSDGKQAAHSFTRDPLRPYMTEEQLAPLAEVGKYPLGDSFKVLFITKAGSDGKQRNEVVRIEKLAQQQAAS